MCARAARHYRLRVHCRVHSVPTEYTLCTRIIKSSSPVKNTSFGHNVSYVRSVVKHNVLTPRTHSYTHLIDVISFREMYITRGLANDTFSEKTYSEHFICFCFFFSLVLFIFHFQLTNKKYICTRNYSRRTIYYNDNKDVYRIVYRDCNIHS